MPIPGDPHKIRRDLAEQARRDAGELDDPYLCGQGSAAPSNDFLGDVTPWESDPGEGLTIGDWPVQAEALEEIDYEHAGEITRIGAPIEGTWVWNESHVHSTALYEELRGRVGTTSTAAWAYPDRRSRITWAWALTTAALAGATAGYALAWWLS